MASSEKLTYEQQQKEDDYSQSSIPMSERKPFVSILSVWIGYAYFPAGVAASIAIGGAFPFMSTVAITAVGCLILAFICGISGSIGQREGLSFGLLSRFCWGRQGFKIAAMVIPLGLVGWDSIHISVAARFLGQMIGAQYQLTCFVLALIFGAVALKGFKFITYLGYVMVPVIIILLFVAANKGLSVIGGWDQLIAAVPSGSGTMSIAAGITAMVGTFACGTGGGSPDIQRWNKTQGQSWLIAVVTFGIFYTYLMVTGAITALGAESTDLIESYIKLGLLLYGGVVLIFLTWTTCDTDYYCSSLDVSAVTKMSRKKGVVIIVACACVLSMARSYLFLMGWLTLMSTLMTPLVGVLASDYYLLHKGKYPKIETTFEAGQIPEYRWASFASWLVGIVVVYLTTKFGIGLPPLQGMFASAVAQLIFAKLIPQPFMAADQQ